MSNETRTIKFLPISDVTTKKKRTVIEAPVSEANKEIISIIRPNLANKFHSKPGTCVLDSSFGPTFPTTQGPGVDLDPKLIHANLYKQNGCIVYFDFNSVNLE